MKYGQYQEETRSNLNLPNYNKLLKYDKEDIKKIFIGQQSDSVDAGNGEPYSLNGGNKGNINNVGIILPAGVLRNLRVYVGQNGITDYSPFVVISIKRQGSSATDLFVNYGALETGKKENLQNEYITDGNMRVYLEIYADEEGTTVSQVSWSVEFFPFQ